MIELERLFICFFFRWHDSKTNKFSNSFPDLRQTLYHLLCLCFFFCTYICVLKIQTKKKMLITYNCTLNICNIKYKTCLWSKNTL